MLAVVFSRGAFGFFAGWSAANAVGYGGGSGVVDGSVLLLGDALVTVRGRSVSFEGCSGQLEEGL